MQLLSNYDRSRGRRNSGTGPSPNGATPAARARGATAAPRGSVGGSTAAPGDRERSRLKLQRSLEQLVQRPVTDQTKRDFLVLCMNEPKI